MQRLRKLFLLVATLLGASHTIPAHSLPDAAADAENPVLDRIARIQQEAKKRQTVNEYLDGQNLTQWVNWPNWPNWNNWVNWPNWGNWYNY